MFLTSNHCFQLKYESSINKVAFSSEKVISSESGERYGDQSLGLWILFWIVDLYFGQKRQFLS